MRGFALKMAIAAAGATVFAVSGCGDSSRSSAEDAAGPPKAAFIKSADAICQKADSKQKKAQIVFSEEHPETPTNALEEELALVGGLPPVQEEAEEIGKLTPPSGDEERVEAIVKGLEEAVAEAEAKPSLLLKGRSPGPFSEVTKLAREYGFNACATPL
jgi:hypothetical protein